jgi:predicted Zn-dependent protease with MMP-like domain
MMPGVHSLRRILLCALAALSVGVGAVSLITGFSDSFVVRLLQSLAVFGAGVAVLGVVTVLAMIHLAGWRDPESEEEFEELVRRSERLAASGELHLPDGVDAVGRPARHGELEAGGQPARRGDIDAVTEPAQPGYIGAAGPPARPEEFDALVRAALDELPLEFHRALEHVAVVVADDGARYGAYGLYQGDTVARDFFHDRILIFRDTLMRDFGHNRALLALQVRRTLRHELAHHLGWDENGVRGLGL